MESDRTEESRQAEPMREKKGKQLVSVLRGADYAHAGGEDAIDLTMEVLGIEKNAVRKILDIGCGLGGTAHYLQENQWGNVTGFDIEDASIEYAIATYGSILFKTTDVVDVHQHFDSESYDVLCAFNVFYAFPDQRAALKSLWQVAQPGGRIVIFDYSIASKSDAHKLSMYRTGESGKPPFIPIAKEESIKLFEESGWKHERTIDVTAQYLRWYNELLDTLHAKEQEVKREFGKERFFKAEETYTKIKEALENETLGGSIFIARKPSR